MQPDVLKFLHDIEQACAALARFTGAKTFADYADDELLRSAVERQFIIIGEALLQALRLDPSLRSFISHSRRIISFRNVIVHG
jgi:uncharacterized protein with HEPN domain